MSKPICHLLNTLIAIMVFICLYGSLREGRSDLVSWEITTLFWIMMCDRAEMGTND